jgi:hypothetical protein
MTKVYIVPCRAVPRQRSQTNRFQLQQSARKSLGTVGKGVFYGGPCRGEQEFGAGREPPFREDLSTEAEE